MRTLEQVLVYALAGIVLGYGYPILCFWIGFGLGWLKLAIEYILRSVT
jgi:hypothetical protein